MFKLGDLVFVDFDGGVGFVFGRVAFVCHSKVKIIQLTRINYSGPTDKMNII